MKFGQWLCEESQAIDEDSQKYSSFTHFVHSRCTRIRSRMVKTIWNRQQLKFFEGIEGFISSSLVKPPNVILPGVVTLAGSIGAGIFGGVFLGSIAPPFFSSFSSFPSIGF